MLTKVVKQGIALFSIKTHNAHTCNLLIHHGLMGSSLQFTLLANHPTLTSRFNTHVIDARNHGNSPHTPTHTITDLANDLL